MKITKTKIERAICYLSGLAIGYGLGADNIFMCFFGMLLMLCRIFIPDEEITDQQ